jgi:hypothetical protein
MYRHSGKVALRPNTPALVVFVTTNATIAPEILWDWSMVNKFCYW